DDYSRFTWVKFLRSKDEAPDFIIKFLKMIQVRLKVPVRRIRTDNETEFVNQMLREYYKEVGISHETSVARSPQQNGVVERCYLTNDSDNLGKLQPKANIRIFISVDPQAPEVIAPIGKVIPPVQAKSTGLPSLTSVDEDAPSLPETQSSVIPQDVEEDVLDIEVAHI
nr:retrovirus-related Pol polyprotein from transposon TNT 1-94 [Tanacetum cinerariifolium]